MQSIEWCHFQWPWVTRNPSFKVTLIFKGECLNGAFYTVQLQIIYLLNLQCNVPLMRGPSAIAESLVRFIKSTHLNAKGGPSGSEVFWRPHFSHDPASSQLLYVSLSRPDDKFCVVMSATCFQTEAGLPELDFCSFTLHYITNFWRGLIKNR